MTEQLKLIEHPLSKVAGVALIWTLFWTMGLGVVQFGENYSPQGVDFAAGMIELGIVVGTFSYGLRLLEFFNFGNKNK